MAQQSITLFLWDVVCIMQLLLLCRKHNTKDSSWWHMHTTTWAHHSFSFLLMMLLRNACDGNPRLLTCMWYDLVEEPTLECTRRNDWLLNPAPPVFYLLDCVTATLALGTAMEPRWPPGDIHSTSSWHEPICDGKRPHTRKYACMEPQTLCDSNGRFRNHTEKP